MNEQAIGKGVVEVEMRDTGVEAGVARIEKSLDTLGTKAVAAGKAAAEGVGQIPASTEDAGKRVDAATRSISNSIQRQVALLEAGGKSTSEYYTLLAQQRGVDLARLKPYLDQLDKANASQQQASRTSGEMSSAMRTLPAQFTDIATSLAGGQDPMLVFIQQGGQLKDMFGGVGPALKAMGQYVLGLVNPFTVSAAALAVLAVGYHMGSKEAKAFSDALVMSNRAAGANADQLATMAANIDGYYGTQAAAAEAITALVSTGRVASQNLEQFAATTMQWSSVTGESVDDVVEKFNLLGKDPLDASVKLDESVRFLTASLYDQISALVEQGKETEAANLAQQAFADTLASRTAEMQGNLGLIERSWNAIKNAIKEAGDELLNVGRQQTYAQQLAEINRKLATGLVSENGRDPRLVTDDERKALLAQRDAVESDMRRAATDASREAERENTRRAGVAAQAQFNKLLDSGASKAQKMAKELAEVDRWARALAAAGNPASAADIATAKTAITKKYAEKPRQARAGLSAGDNALASIEADTAARRREIDLLFAEDEGARRLTSTQEKLLEVQQKLAKATTAAQRAPLEKQQAALQELEKVESELTAQQKMRDSAKELSTAITKQRQVEVDTIATRVSSLKDESKQMAEQIEMLGMTAVQIANLRVVRAQEALEKAQSTGESEAVIQKLKEELAIRQTLAGQAVELSDKQRSAERALSSSIEEYSRRATDGAAAVQSVFGTVTKGMEDNLTQFFMTGKAGWKDFANSVVEQIVRIQMQKAIAGIASSALEMIGPSVIGSANGNAFQGGQLVHAFANGGAFTNTIAKGPTIAPMALFGEAGPEAIMPLARDSSGRLGVRSSGEGTQAVAVSVNVTNASSQPVNASASQPKWDGKQWVIGVVLEDLNRGGPIRQAIGRM